jgi:polar amino acid transport system substrate-binding protein
LIDEGVANRPDVAWTKRLLAIAVVAFMLAFPSLAIGGEVLDRINKTGILTVAMDPEWPPNSRQRPDGEFEGFDVDLVNEIAQRLSVKVAYFLPYSFDDVLAGGWKGRWDIATSVTPTIERNKHIAFAGVSVYAPSALAVNLQSNIKVVAEASGKRIGVLSGSEYEKILTRESFSVIGMPPIAYRIDDPLIIRFESTEELYDALAEGVEVDAVIDDLTGHMFRIKHGAPIRIVGGPLSYTPSSIAIEHGDPELAARLDAVIDAMHSDGTLSAISLKWFDYDMTKPR